MRILIIILFSTKLKIMKKNSILLLVVVLFTSCGGKSGKDLAQEVCDCSSKANDMPAADPKRADAIHNCSVKQMEAWDKIKDDSKKSDEFNKKLSECSTEMIKKAFGK